MLTKIYEITMLRGNYNHLFTLKGMGFYIRIGGHFVSLSDSNFN